MKETAQIVEIQGSLIKLQCQPAGGCKSCAGNTFCSVKEQKIIAENTGNLTVAEGDMVEYEIPPGGTIGAGFMVLIFPLILFIGAYFLASEILGLQQEFIKVLFGLAGLGGGFGLNYLLGKYMKQPLPRITKIIS